MVRLLFDKQMQKLKLLLHFHILPNIYGYSLPHSHRKQVDTSLDTCNEEVLAQIQDLQTNKGTQFHKQFPNEKQMLYQNRTTLWNKKWNENLTALAQLAKHLLAYSSPFTPQTGSRSFGHKHGSGSSTQGHALSQATSYNLNVVL